MTPSSDDEATFNTAAGAVDVGFLSVSLVGSELAISIALIGTCTCLFTVNDQAV